MLNLIPGKLYYLKYKYSSKLLATVESRTVIYYHNDLNNSEFLPLNHPVMFINQDFMSLKLGPLEMNYILYKSQIWVVHNEIYQDPLLDGITHG